MPPVEAPIATMSQASPLDGTGAGGRWMTGTGGGGGGTARVVSRSSRSSSCAANVQQHHEAFQAFGAAGGPFVEGQGLSLSLSPPLQRLEMAKQAEELRVQDSVLYFNRQQQHQGGPSVQQQQLPMALHG